MNYIYLLGFPPFDWIGEKIINGVASFFYTILLLLNTAIYSFISFIYNIFLLLAGGGSIFDKTQINGLVSRIYVIIGVVVLFLVAYSLLKSMINPDESLKGKKSPVNIIKDVIISIVLISFVPTIFQFAFEFQNSLLVENTIGKIIAGSKEGSTDHQNTIREGGYTMAEGVWQAFIYVNPDGDKDGTPFCSNEEEELNLKTSDGVDCKKVMVDSTTSFNDLWKKSRENTTFTNMIMLVPRIIDGQVSYIFLLDTVAGVFVLFVLLQYCLDMALRLVKLAVYELIAPIPILSRIIPNEQASKVFSNWIKATLSTFTEVFIRIAILYFAVIIISTVGASITNIFDGGLLTFANSKHLFLTGLIAKALIIIGIILFVKQAPEILKEITGLDSGKYNPIKSAMQTASLLGGGVTAAARIWNDDKNPDGSKKNAFNRFRSALGGAGSAAYRSMWNRDNVKDPKSMAENASKAAKNAIDAHNKRVARNARYSQPGESRFNDAWDTIKRWSGADKSREVLEAKKKVYDEAVGFQKELFDLAADDAEVLAFEGQKKAAQEKIIDRDNIEKEIKEAHRRQLTNAKRSALQAANPNKAATEIEAMLAAEQANIESALASQQSAIDSEVDSKLVQMRRDQAATVDMYDNLVKVAKLKVIQKKLAEGKDGRYLAVSEKAKVFKSQHMNDEVVSSMTTDLQEAFKNNVNPAELDKILSSTDSDYVKRQMDIIKGSVAAGPGDAISGAVGLMADNEGAKKASGRQAAEIAKLLQEEKGKEAEKK